MWRQGLCRHATRGMSRMLQILFLRYRQGFLCFILFSSLWYIAHNSVTRYPILMGFALKCNICELPESGVENLKIEIFDMRLISLDRVTYNAKRCTKLTCSRGTFGENPVLKLYLDLTKGISLRCGCSCLNSCHSGIGTFSYSTGHPPLWASRISSTTCWPGLGWKGQK